MYTAVELKDLKMKPRINDIDLKILADYYELYLHPFIYQYSIKTNAGRKEIELRFNYENFCHLLGLETVAKDSTPYKNLHNFRGLDGWDNVNRSIIDIAYLKRLNKRKFQNIKAKLVYFYLLPELLANPLAVNFNNMNVKPPTRIDCEIMFYSKVKNDNAIIHLGIKKDESLGYFIPKTFFVEKVSEKRDDVYLARQEEIVTIILDRVIIQH